MALQSTFRRAALTFFHRSFVPPVRTPVRIVGAHAFSSNQSSPQQDSRPATLHKHQEQSDNSPYSRSPSRVSRNQTERFRQRPDANISTAPENERYFGNIPPVADEKNLRNFLKHAGFSVAKIRIAMDPFTGNNPGYCFVEFETKKDADRAVELLTGREFRGRYLRVEHVASKQRRMKPKGAEHVLDFWSPEKAVQHFDYARRGQRLLINGLPPRRKLKQGILNQKLVQFFQGFTVEAISKPLIPPESYDTPHPYNAPCHCYVDFATAADADKAIDTLNGQIGPWGQPLTIEKQRKNWAKPKPAPKQRPRRALFDLDYEDQ
ncbi:hypothetical protein BDW60DRAFT_26806 [Aspergillus nidulans var. acristatus]